jgi:hypothetical protein
MKRVALAAVVLASAGMLVAPSAHAATNLIPNGSFDQGLNPHPSVPTDPNQEPVAPLGWAFEGAGAFDATGQGAHNNAGYCAAISAPASGGTHVHQQPAPQAPPVDVDVTAKDGTKAAYSVAPAWRPAAPITTGIAGGKSYTISGYYAWNVANVGDGAMARLRWLAPTGAVIRTDEWKRASVQDASYLNWTAFSATTTAPAGAVAVVPLFGAIDTVNPFTQIRWDDVSLTTP